MVVARRRAASARLVVAPQTRHRPDARPRRAGRGNQARVQPRVRRTDRRAGSPRRDVPAHGVRARSAARRLRPRWRGRLPRPDAADAPRRRPLGDQRDPRSGGGRRVTTTSADTHERVLRIAGDRIRVRIRGEGDPVLLINGLGANVAMWNSLAEQLTGFEVISYDAAGTGHSSTPLL